MPISDELGNPRNEGRARKRKKKKKNTIEYELEGSLSSRSYERPEQISSIATYDDTIEMT